MVTTVTKDTYKAEIADEKKPIIIDVFATWCGPCIQMMPVIDALAQEMPYYKFVKVNVDESRELAIQFGVTAIPTFVFMKNNEVVAKETGFMTKEDFITKITAVFGK